MKWNKSIPRKFFLTKFHFLPFQKWPKINFWTGKKFKTAKNVISRKMFLIYLISRVFCLDFFKVSGLLWEGSTTALHIIMNVLTIQKLFWGKKNLWSFLITTSVKLSPTSSLTDWACHTASKASVRFNSLNHHFWVHNIKSYIVKNSTYSNKTGIFVI